MAEQIDLALNDPGCRFLLLTAEPGAGKTAFSAWLAHQHQAWLRYFIRRDSQVPLSSGEARSFLFAVGHQLAALHPTIFRPDKLEITVKQRVGELRAGGSLEGITVEDLHVSPFYQTALKVEQQVQLVAGELAGLSVKRLVAQERLLDVGNLQYLALLDPAQTLLKEDPAKRIVILVDALDELRYQPGQDNLLNWLAGCPELPPNVRIVLTSRPEGVLETFQRRQRLWLKEVTIDHRSEEVQVDLHHSIVEFTTGASIRNALSGQKMVSADFEARAMAKADGNFQYLSSLFRGIEQALEEGATEHLSRLLRVEDVPAGLEELYAFFLTLIRDSVAGQSVEIPTDSSLAVHYVPAWEGLYQPIQGVLAVALEPLEIGQIGGFSGARVEHRWLSPALERLRPFLDREGDCYRLYHSTFPEFLTSPKTRTSYPRCYLSPGEWHRKIAAHYRRGARSWHEVNWELVDEYGLRHLSSHIVAGYTDGLKQISEMTNAAFISAKSVRFNTERSVLDDVRLAIRAAREAGDLPLLLRWTWIYAGWRDRIAQAMVPELLHLYVRTGQAERALDMIKALGSTRLGSSGEERKAPEYMAYALAEQGLVEEALAVVRAISDEPYRDRVLSGVAQRVARQDRTRAIQIIRDDHISSVNPQLCRILAEDEAYLEDALEIAHNAAPALEAIALQVAHRDIFRALAIIDSIQPYYEDSGGNTWWRTNDVARADLAIQIVGTNSSQALALLRRIESTQEMYRALIGIVSGLAEIDARQALAVIDSFGVMHDLVRGLVLAHIARGSGDSATAESIRQRWDIYRTGQLFSYVGEDLIDLIARLDLTALRSHPLAFDIASDAIARLEDSVRESASGRLYGDLISAKRVYEAVGVLGAALAVFDLDRALNFLDWAFKQESLRTSGALEKREALLMIVDVVARFDPKSALRVIDRIEGTQLHLASVAAVKRVSEYSYEQALAIVDGVEPSYSYTKAILLGILGNSLAPHEKEKARELLSRVPHYVQSNGFRYPLREVVKVLAGEIARSSTDRGIALAEHYRSFWSKEDALKGIHLVDVARGAAEHDVERAVQLASHITDAFGLAQVMLEITRHTLVRDEAISALQKASTVLINKGWYAIEGHHITLLADLAVEMASLAPWSALDLVKHMQRGAGQQRALKATLQAILHEVSPFWESIPLPLWVLQDLVERLFLVDSGTGMHTEIFRTLLGLLDPALNTPMLDWLETKDPSLSLELRGWYLAESDPDAALALFATVGLESVAQGEVIVRSAARFPDRALELYHQGHEEPEVLIEAIGAIAQRDSTRALAITVAEHWEFQPDRWRALAAVAGAVAKSDWQQALDIIQPISDDTLRSIALSRMVAAMPRNLSPRDIDLAITRLTTEAGAFLHPNDCFDIYESLIVFLQACPLPRSSATVTLIGAIGMGDRGVYLQLLPEITRLVCRGDLRMPVGLEAEPAIIEALLDA